jgi:hypothetical protein
MEIELAVHIWKHQGLQTVLLTLALTEALSSGRWLAPSCCCIVLPAVSGIFLLCHATPNQDVYVDRHLCPFWH